MRRDDEAIFVTEVRDDPRELLAITHIERASFPEREPDVVGELKRPWAKLWVARIGSEEAPPQGFLLCWLVSTEVHVLSVATAPTMRRRGLGRALMHKALAEAGAREAECILLEVRRSNRAAIRLYRELGFRATALRTGYYVDGEDGVEMTLVLDPETGEIQPGPDEITLEET